MSKKYHNILSSLYFNMAPYPPMKGVICEHRNCIRSSIDRSWYRITDLELWFESDFEFGEELITNRVSENGKYYFTKHMRCFE